MSTPTAAPGSDRPPRIGALGTLVWDTIQARDARVHPVEEWGGMSYALAALDASLPPTWEIVPIVRIGRDLSESALRHLRELPRMDLEAGVRVVPDPNNRVELRYQDGDRRTERLTGGVSPWSWPELAPVVRSCDALYVNFVSGHELELDTARALRAGFDGPSYADLHSLFLGTGPRGLRVPRELPSSGAWLRCFDAVQMNEVEFELLGRAWGDPWQLAADVVGQELKVVLVTLGSRGAAYVAGPGFQADPSGWAATRHTVGVAGPTVSGRVPVSGGALDGDPTGCGDVWGATLFARLLAGDSLEAAMATANLRAARNVTHRGARGLHHHLLGRLGPETA
jgi:sugar/nucleoside kinase (ribokinase family)